MPEYTDATLTAFLNAFRPAPEGLLLANLPERTGLPAEDLPGIRAHLESLGFSFVDDEEDGRWRLEGSPDKLLPFWVQAGLRCDRLGSSVYYKESMGSTQDIAFELMVEGRAHGTLVLTEEQTSGRGRGEKVWHTTPGKSLAFSVLLDLEPPDTFASVLTIAIAASVARAIQDLAGLPARIDFPNDITVHGRKVAGILLEVKDYGVPERRAVAGVGINVNQMRDELPEEIRDLATSLRAEHRDQEFIRRPRLLRYILRGLEKWLDRIAQGNFEELEAEWNRFSGIEGKEVIVRRGEETLRGRVAEAKIREGLLVRPSSGEPQRIRLEHVSDLSLVEEE